ncbi:MAG: ABC transporter permease, partial [Anaerolineaceae bacterium]|nr:ABC transporter permease [Anaerolineaceae bacterium]
MTVILKLLKNPTSLIGILLLITFVVIAIFAPLIAPVPENSRDAYMIPRDGFRNEPSVPSEEHILGTTEGQYDILYGIVWGTRTAFRVGIIITVLTLFI